MLKNSVLFVSLIYSLSCSGSSGNSSSMAESVIGSWEIESLQVQIDGKIQMDVAERPDPKDPFKKRNFSDWVQLKIDKNQVQQIYTDFVHVMSVEAPYHLEGDTLVMDEPSEPNKLLNMSDLKVMSVSKDQIVVKYLSDDKMSFVFNRIQEDQLATKTAQEIHFAKRLDVEVKFDEARSPLKLSKTVVGKEGVEKNVHYGAIDCSVSDGQKLNFSYMVIKATDDNLTSTVMGQDYFSAQYDGVDLDLNGPQSEWTQSAPVKLYINTLEKSVYDQDNDCQSQIQREGAVLKIATQCESADKKTQFKFQGQCLLRDHR